MNEESATNENLITNGKIVTIIDQNDFSVLEDLFQQMVESFNEQERTNLDASTFYESGADFAYYWIPKPMPLDFVCDWGFTLKAIYDNDIIEKPEVTTLKDKYIFTREELDQYSTELANEHIKQNEVESERKQINDQYKEKLNEIKANIDKLSGRVSRGYEWTDMDVKIVIDFERGKRLYKQAKDGRIVKEEALKEEDKTFVLAQSQLNLFEAKEMGNPDDPEDEVNE
jgi:hypothetical protein